METASGGAAGSSGGTPAAFKTEIERRVDKLEERVGRLEPKAVPDPRAMPPEIRKYIERQAEVATSTADKIAQRIIDADERADAAVAQAVAQANAARANLVDVRTAWRRDLDKGRAALASMTADRDDLSLRLTLANGDLATVLAALAGARADCISIGREATDFSTRLNHVWAALEKQGFRPSTQVPQPDLAAFVMSTIESLRQDAVRATDKLRSAHAEVSSRDAEVKRLRARLAEGRKIAEEYLAQHAICGEEDEGMGCPCGDCDAARAWLGRPSKPGEATSPRGSVTAALGVLRYLAAKDCTSRDMHVRAATCIEAKIAKPWCEHCTARSAVVALDASAGGTTVVRANRVPDAGAECSDNPPVGVALAAGPDPDPSDVPACGEQPSVEAPECNCPTAHGPTSVMSHDCPTHGAPLHGA